MNRTAGVGDPYWYEWSVGQEFVLTMLDPDAGIASVTLQANDGKGLDDVVVAYVNGDRRCIQVKHTRDGATLTFGDLVSSGTSGESLLAAIVRAWGELRQADGRRCDAQLVTNRALGAQSAKSVSVGVTRPPLDRFLAILSEQSQRAATLSDLRFPAEWMPAWTAEWLPQLSALESDGHRLEFLRSFSIDASHYDLDTIETVLETRMSQLFAVARPVATQLSGSLDKALRRWATSAPVGQSRAITVKSVYAELCLCVDRPIGDHAIVPPAPFLESRRACADDITFRVQQRTAPIVFVSGAPGSGKTSILSWLASQRDSPIDLRYHAYRPITLDSQLLPADAGEASSPRALWTDLLLQLRDTSRGSLATLRMPVHAGSLSVDAIRENVLRIANALGEQLNRPFVLSIDGIDHAARAGNPTATFLASLVPPELVPRYVVILIGGQPPEAYPNYPLWLRVPSLDVHRIDLEQLTHGDTLQLARQHLPVLDSVAQESVARDIWAVCEGHTLATVFAIEEARLLGDTVAPLLSRLAERRLAAGVDSYYEQLWTSVVARSGMSSQAAVRVAACLSLMPRRTTPETLRAVLGEPSATDVALADVLRGLRPVVVEEGDGFRVFHNDVRVFLQRLLVADPPLYRDCASRLADHLATGTDAQARHEAAIGLLGVANRPRDQASLFSPEYVIEGFAVGRTLEQLTHQGMIASDAIVAIDEDWSLAHQVATGLRTVLQLSNSVEGYDASRGGDSLRSDAPLASLPVERKPIDIAKWDIAVISDALDDLELLAESGSRERARAAMLRWFSGRTPAQIVGAFPVGDEHSAGFGHEEHRQALSRIGVLSVTLDVAFPISGRAKEERECDAAFATGLFDAAFQCSDRRRFQRILARAGVSFYPRDVERLLTRLRTARAWKRLASVVHLLARAPERYDLALRLEAALSSSILGEFRCGRSFALPLLEDPSRTLSELTAQHEGSDVDAGPLPLLVKFTVLVALHAPQRNPSALAEELTNAFSRAFDRPDEKANIRRLLYGAAILGSLVATTRDQQLRSVDVVPSRVAQVISTLVEGILSQERRPFAFPALAESIVRGLAECADCDAELGESFHEQYRRIFTVKHLPTQFLDIWWASFYSRGEQKELIAYADTWIGPEGLVWAMSLDDRRSIVIPLSKHLREIGEDARATAALGQLRWSHTGYSSHKEYVLEDPMDWFQALAQGSPSTWRDEGMRLIQLSQYVAEVGDNRFRGQIESAVLTAASVDCPSSLLQLTREPTAMFTSDDPALVDGLVGLVSRATLDEADLQCIWIFCSSALAWQSEYDRNRIVRVRKAILDALPRKRHAIVADWMQNVAPAEFGSLAESDDDAEQRVQLTAAKADGRLSSDAMQALCSSGAWRDAAKRFELATQSHSPDVVLLRDIGWSALARRETREWRYDSSTQLLQALFPYLTSEQRWELARSVISGSPDDSDVTSLATRAGNLEVLCRLEAAERGSAALRDGLRSVLDMHDAWRTGAGRLPSTTAFRAPRNAISPLRWRDVFAALLVEMVAQDEQTYVQAALRGLHQLVKIDPSLHDAILRAVDLATHPEVRRRFLRIADVLASSASSGSLLRWLQGIMETATRLDDALQAWIALMRAARTLGTAEPVWPTPSSIETVIIPVARSLVSRPASRHGMFESSGRASESILKQLSEALDDDLADVVAEHADRVRHEPAASRERQHRNRHTLDMIANSDSDAELDRLFDLLRARERAGRFRDLPIRHLAQLVTTFADADVFLRTPVPFHGDVEWPVDEKLDTSLALGEPHTEALLTDALEAGLPPDHRLIAGCITSFSRKVDVRLRVDYQSVSRGLNRSSALPVVVNGCGATLYEDYGALFTVGDGRWLTARLAGMLSFTDATMECYPTGAWTSRLRWRPSRFDPLVWTRDGERAAWLERQHGPVRNLYGQDYLFRQPIMTRWVCRNACWPESLDKIVRRQTHFSVDRVDG